MFTFAKYTFHSGKHISRNELSTKLFITINSASHCELSHIDDIECTQAFLRDSWRFKTVGRNDNTVCLVSFRHKLAPCQNIRRCFHLKCDQRRIYIVDANICWNILPNSVIKKTCRAALFSLPYTTHIQILSESCSLGKFPPSSKIEQTVLSILFWTFSAW